MRAVITKARTEAHGHIQACETGRPCIDDRCAACRVSVNKMYNLPPDSIELYCNIHNTYTNLDLTLLPLSRRVARTLHPARTRRIGCLDHVTRQGRSGDSMDEVRSLAEGLAVGFRQDPTFPIDQRSFATG